MYIYTTNAGVNTAVNLSPTESWLWRCTQAHSTSQAVPLTSPKPASHPRVPLVPAPQHHPQPTHHPSSCRCHPWLHGTRPAQCSVRQILEPGPGLVQRPPCASLARSQARLDTGPGEFVPALALPSNVFGQSPMGHLHPSPAVRTAALPTSQNLLLLTQHYKRTETGSSLSYCVLKKSPIPKAVSNS